MCLLANQVIFHNGDNDWQKIEIHLSLGLIVVSELEKLRMIRSIYLVVLGAALALPAQAYEWPWQSQKDVRYGYCKGFVTAGLAEEQLGMISRVDLWLTLNHILRAQFSDESISDTDFQEGRDRLAALAANADYQGIRDVADQECYLGRNRRSQG